MKDNIYTLENLYKERKVVIERLESTKSILVKRIGNGKDSTAFEKQYNRTLSKEVQELQYLLKLYDQLIEKVKLTTDSKILVKS